MLQNSTLLFLLIIASITDLTTHSIPNRITYSGILLAITLSIVTPSSPPLLISLPGIIIGGLLTLPFYALRHMAAGDIKLIAMCGGFLGFPLILTTTLLSMVFSGIFAIIFLTYYRLFKNKTTTPKLIPFAPFVTCATITTLLNPIFFQPLNTILGL